MGPDLAVGKDVPGVEDAQELAVHASVGPDLAVGKDARRRKTAAED